MPINQYFSYRKGELYCERLALSEIAQKVGTPFYLYSRSAFEDRFLSLRAALAPVKALVCYAVKANSNIAVLKALVDLGAGLDIVSGGELYRAIQAGCPPKKIVFAGVGKLGSEIREALKLGILSFNVESQAELELINNVACRMKLKARVALRINPNVDAKTHAKITTGKAENKFGIDFDQAEKIFLDPDRYPALCLKGLHIHIGSQMTELAPFKAAYTKILRFAERLKKKGVSIESIDLGGGLGIRYREETPLTAREYGCLVASIFKGKDYKLLIEPGRYIAGNSGVLVTRVLYVKHSRRKNFIIVDSAMNELVRPAMYEAYHRIVPVGKTKRKPMRADIVGPICETGDVLGYDRVIPEVREGELLAILSGGAYGFSMSSNYNSRPRPAEIMVKGNRFSVIRKRESLEDLVSGEKVV